jgi:hypothetical protein
MSQMNDIKVRLILTIQEDDADLDISAATSISIIVKKPNGDSNTYTASFFTDGTDAKIYYDTVSGDLDQSGMYRTQGLIELNGGTYYTSIKSFKIHCNL